MLKGYSASYYLLCVVAFLSMLSIMVTNPILSLFAEEIGATGVWIGYAVSGYWISRVVLEIPSGYVSSKFGYYKSMVFGLALTVMGNIMLVFVNNPVHLVFVRAVNGFGAPFFFAVSMTFIVNLFGAEKRGTAMGVFQGIEFIGTIIGSAVSGKLVQELGWQGGFMVALALSVAALLLFVVPPYIRREIVRGPTSKPLTMREIFGVLKNKTLLIMAAATVAEFIMTNGLIITIVPLFTRGTLGFSLADVGYVMGARSLGFVVAMFTMGSISDRIGRRPVLMFGLTATAIMVVVMSFFYTFFTLAAVICVIGFTSGAIWIVGPVISAEAVDSSQRGAAIGAYRTFFDLGSVIGPILMTAVMSGYGVKYCFYIAAALLLVNVPLTYMIEETVKTEGAVMAH
ncbi:MAG TPA: MFS transporter [Candidatus Krumholzibacteriaceae bacterium]|nr:MFS transporter [Candidatus Krumholzibacteriaceae bacterium]